MLYFDSIQDLLVLAQSHKLLTCSKHQVYVVKVNSKPLALNLFKQYTNFTKQYKLNKCDVILQLLLTVSAINQPFQEEKTEG